jgi:AcrR family transcriptional regulator
MAERTRPKRAPQIPKAQATKLFINAVIDLLETRPIADISDQLIADTAGINRATIYRHFGTRFELLDAVVAELTQQRLATASKTVSSAADLFVLPADTFADIEALALVEIANFELSAEQLGWESDNR